MTIEAKIIADSVNPDGKRITTIEARYPRFIHSQVMTHRQFSRNAQSSRACPVEKMIKEIESDPAMPIHWGANQRGMQAGEELDEIERFRSMWLESRDDAVRWARAFATDNIHKQIVNRLLEPFMHISVIITATEWDNFFDLRLHDDAQPEIAELARVMKEEMIRNVPLNIQWGEWHVPYVESIGSDYDLCGYIGYPNAENEQFEVITSEAQEMSTAACARVSYNNHDGSKRNYEKDVKLHDMLLESGHMSPFEHQACAMAGQWSNFNGFRSYRWEIENDSK